VGRLVPEPIFTVIYNGKNITEAISRYLISLEFEDTEEGESSGVEINLENVDGLWSNGWYPEKGASLDVTIDKINCGNFEIDEIELDGPPDTVTIKALANIPTEKALNTKKSKAHEKKSLRQIAQATAHANGLTLVGSVPNIFLERVTQRRMTDLKFLRKISWDYGIIFSVRGKKLIYSSLMDIHKREPSFKLDKTELTRYNITDKTSGIFKEVKIKHHNVGKRKLVSYKTSATNVETLSNKDDVTYKVITSADTLVLHKRVENDQQAEAVAKAVLYRMNGQAQTGTIDGPGHIYALAGNNVMLTGLGVAGSGSYHITQVTHKVDRGSSWTFSATIKRVTVAPKSQQRSKGKQPIKNSNTSIPVLRQNNKDGVGFNTIGS
jgi:uncharacterized protein